VNAPTKILKADANVISAFLYTLFAPDFVHAFPDAWIEIVFIRPNGKIPLPGSADIVAAVTTRMR